MGYRPFVIISCSNQSQEPGTRCMAQVTGSMEVFLLLSSALRRPEAMGTGDSYPPSKCLQHWPSCQELGFSREDMFKS